MARSIVASFAQAVVITTLCGLVGFSFAYLPDAHRSDAWPLAVVGAAIGAGACLASLPFRRDASSFNSHASQTTIRGIRLSILGLFLAVLGWLVTVFHSPSIGYVTVVLGVLAGGVGIALINIGKRQPHG